MTLKKPRILLSLPTGAAEVFLKTEPSRLSGIFVASDPPDSQLGSAGGTAHLLAEAWKAQNKGEGFTDWLRAAPSLVIHGSGESRRLPSYAAPGKPVVPIPLLHETSAQRLDQTLMDFLLEAYERIFWPAPETYRLMIACGDAHLQNLRWLPPYPEADVLIVGLPTSVEEAERHGVLICPADSPEQLSQFLHKPAARQLQALDASQRFFLDTGIWLLSERAVMTLMAKCGWDENRNAFHTAVAETFDLYGEFGPPLGQTPSSPDPDISALAGAVLPLEDARFYHFGSNRSLLASVAQLQHPASRQRSFGHASMEIRVEPVILNADVGVELTEANRYIWIENSVVPSSWRLSERHVITGIPENDWSLSLDPGACLDVTPLKNGLLCFRPYGFDDPFRGAIGDAGTSWLDRPAPDWFASRSIGLADAGIDPDTDIQEAPIFPSLLPGTMDNAFLAWLLTPNPSDSPGMRKRWLDTPRLSARQLLREVDIEALVSRRTALMRSYAEGIDREYWLELCADLDLSATAALFKHHGWTPPAPATDPACTTLGRVHDSMFRFSLAKDGGGDHETRAFRQLRDLMIEQAVVHPVHPRRNVLEDQIVWGRCPIRLDLAGGWTDTPPYCLEHGGRVVNVASNLNGQPPIQVFGRICDKPEILLRSIDLGIDETIRTYDELTQYSKLGSGFGIARAALALAGFEPRFHAAQGYASLQEQLHDEFGGGIELSMLAAVPKGSGLGTSSILASTMLGTLSELCGLHWNRDDLFERTLVLEQMLTSGGGWQDQIGGVCPGVKMIEAQPGPRQRFVIRGLPGTFFKDDYANRMVLLYYTGLTRVAHDILGEIVRGLFLNSAEHLRIIEELGQNADFIADALQRGDWDAFCEAIARNWRLNQRLDSGTNPPAVQSILDTVSDHLRACKLLGAGGGGYMLMFAKDVEAASRIRLALESAPPNPRARFVDLGLSEGGFQVTRS